jgi:Fe-S oxidoreductase
MEEIYHCIRCGFCKAKCITLPEIGIESAGPRGRMILLRGILEDYLEMNRKVLERLLQCTTCGACSLNCPSGLDIPRIFEEFRRIAYEAGIVNKNHLRMVRNVEKFGNPYGEAKRMREERKGDTALFLGCTTRFRRKKTLEKALKIAEVLNWSIIEEVCCSSPLLRIGSIEVAEKLMKENYSKLNKFLKIVVLCAGCYRTFVEDYSRRNLKLNVVHISEALLRYEFSSHLEQATYHDPCHLGRHLGVYDPPRDLLKKSGIQIVEMETNKENSRCCGGGGGFRSAFPEFSKRIAERRIEEARKVSHVLLTSCPFCHVNLSEVSRDLEVYDIIDVLEI